MDLPLESVYCCKLHITSAILLKFHNLNANRYEVSSSSYTPFEYVYEFLHELVSFVFGCILILKDPPILGNLDQAEKHTTCVI